MQFDEAYSEIASSTLVGRSRCEVLHDCLKRTSDVPGDLAEVGVYRGGTLKLLALLAPQKIVHGFDTFSGMPETDPEKDNHHRKGDFQKTSYAQVAAFVSGLQNIRLYEGVFPHTAVLVADKSFSFVHIDADIYPSVLASCEFFYPRMSRGGVIVSDDYGSRNCLGAKSAMDEFFRNKPETITRGAKCQAIVVINN